MSGVPSFHERAANGECEAFSIIAAAHYKRAEDGAEPAIIALARAVEFGRLAAIRGGRRERVTFLYLLEEHSHALRDAGMDALGDIAQGEAFALAEHMANDGDDEVGDMLVKGASQVEAGVLLVARDLMGLGVN